MGVTARKQRRAANREAEEQGEGDHCRFHGNSPFSVSLPRVSGCPLTLGTLPDLCRVMIAAEPARTADPSGRPRPPTWDLGLIRPVQHTLIVAPQGGALAALAAAAPSSPTTRPADARVNDHPSLPCPDTGRLSPITYWDRLQGEDPRRREPSPRRGEPSRTAPTSNAPKSTSPAITKLMIVLQALRRRFALSPSRTRPGPTAPRSDWRRRRAWPGCCR